MHDLNLILTLTGGLAAALLCGYATQRLGLSPIVGYLLAGIAVGPHTPGFIADHAVAEQLAEVGVILLMFGVGLHFKLKELLAVRRVAIPGAIGQILTATLLAAVVSRGFGWDWTAGVIYGLAISVASTVVLVRVLSDNRDLHTPAGHIAIGWLVIEDLFTVVVLVLMPALFGAESEGTGAGGLSLAIGLAAVNIAALVAFTAVVGRRLIPWLLDRVAAARSRELFTLTVLVVALGISVGSATLFGVSMALGAFLAGMVVGRSEYSLRAASEALPMRDAFAVLFFVSVGMLFDPSLVIEAPGKLAATLGVILLGKPIAAVSIVLFLRYPPRVALAVAVALAQIGEFSFILAVLGNQLGVLPLEATNLLVGAAILSITLNPVLYRLVGPIESWACRRPRLWGWLTARAGAGLAAQPTAALDPAAAGSGRFRAIVVGYGPVGRTVTRLLRDNGIEPMVIELNMETVRRLRDEGIPAAYGDANNQSVLKAAGAETAGSLILSASGISGIEEIIRLARALNPDLRILARSDYLQDAPALRASGAAVVFSDEGEMALAFTVAILRELGATHEQIDRERDRVHAELFGPLAAPEPTDAPAVPPERAPAPAATAEDTAGGNAAAGAARPDHEAPSPRRER